ncbi:hypothetical protein, partial [Enterococcus faecium]
QTLVTICTIASLYAGVGIYAEMVGVPEYIMLYSFLVCFCIYLMLLSYVWKITSFLKDKVKKN